MKWNRLLILGAGACLMAAVVVFTANPSLDAQDKKGSAAGGGGQFEGKILMVYEKGAGVERFSYAIDGASVAEISGLRFLVGRGVKGQELAEGRKVRIAWENIAAIVEFDDMKSYVKQAVPVATKE
ncbi:MAG: hypothetical protein EXS05_21590 [Planctomycetaceae bacterium]|nr:hypothetical protein [Planctomycetaceae bacterium]